MAKRLFTSESVTEGHPDKICDQISDAVLDAILEQDPDSEITLHYIRHLIASGAVPVIHVGRKKLVDVDQLLAYLAAGNEAPTTTDPAVGYGKLRRIDL